MVNGSRNSATQKKSHRGCKRKLMVNDNLFPYVLLFEPFRLNSADIFYSLSIFLSPCLFLLTGFPDRCDHEPPVDAIPMEASLESDVRLMRAYCVCNSASQGFFHSLT